MLLYITFFVYDGYVPYDIIKYVIGDFLFTNRPFSQQTFYLGKAGKARVKE